ncbi:MAG: CBS domain-containing protein [Anaerolineae bacterium]|jgi:CBS domain-containing protein|nr:MAG: CBS domain-containing protein [Anaerolineae bacterium]MCL4878571.1 CBS domain-containing protein [Anaerolineae bacterium]
MKNKIVKNWMTKDPVTIGPDATLPEVHEKMKEYGIRRLPVVDEEDTLLGIISLSDVQEAEPSDAKALNIYELTYLLSKIKVGRLMKKDVITVTPDTSIADCAKLMMEKKIGGLPVVENGKVVGIITESDIFRLVVKEYTE